LDLQRAGSDRIAVGDRPHVGVFPGPRHAMDTVRRRLIELLRANEMDAREISRVLGIREKAVYEHLPHIARTLAGRGEKLDMVPPECLACGYVFTDRARVTRPGRCPRCRATRVSAPAYRIR
jgi:predicted Zn-ribbon and HTH transcriptional regulator